MTASVSPRHSRNPRRIGLTGRMPLIALLAMLGFTLVLLMLRVPAASADDAYDLINGSDEQIQELQNSNQPEQPADDSDVAQQPARPKATGDPCLDNVPVRSPLGGAVRVVQLVNCSNQILLGATNAAGTPSLPAHVPVFPREKTWIMQPFNPAKPAAGTNVLTIDIPKQWASTGPVHSVGPNIWVRTGCRYDIPSGRAQCETGGCGGQYDCSSSDLGLPAFTTFTEWNFFQDGPMPSKYHIDNFDVSAVNGVSLNVDIQPVGGDTADPGNPINPFWEFKNYPLTVHGADLRSSKLCPTDFTLKRSDIDKSGIFGFVLLNNQGKPQGGDTTLACLNNCGKYKFPAEPSMDCDPTTDEKCRNYLTFCAANPKYYGTQYDPMAPLGINNCINSGVYDDSLCPLNGSCWNNGGTLTGKTIRGTCQLRAFYKNDPKLCPDTICTFPYGGYTNPYTGKFFKDLSTQPPAELCSDVDPTNTAAQCVGDDTIHQVLNHVYTWPNDPQTYADDAPLYRVVYAPGGTTEPITKPDTIPECSKLPDLYGFKHQYGGPKSGTLGCDISVNRDDADFAVAVPAIKCKQSSDCPNKNCNVPEGFCSNWGCNLDPTGSGDEGIVCRWNPLPSKSICAPPTTDKYVTKSACGLIPTGTALVSGSFNPATNDPLFAEVIVPAVQSKVTTPPKISGCAASWTMVTSQFIQTNEGLAVWYSGKASAGPACKVSVTLAGPNPASLKVYDIPLFNGTIDKTDGTTGGPANGPVASAGTVTTTHAPDLLLGNLILANQRTVPKTYWSESLFDDKKTFFPTDDGADFLPGFLAFSGSADAGHEFLGTAGPHTLSRKSFPRPGVMTDFGGALIAIQLKKVATKKKP